MTKQTLRQTIGTLLRALPPAAFREAGIRALERIRQSPLWDYQRILFFLSTDLELDTAPLMEAALADQKEVYAPRIEGEGLGFYRVFSPAGPWRAGAFNIREPEAAGMGDALDEGGGPFLVLVPGLAFDRRGGRLGHGRGFYDRFFAGLDLRRGTSGGTEKNYTALGLCLEAQIVSRVPADGRDKPMDALCTGNSLMRIS